MPLSPSPQPTLRRRVGLAWLLLALLLAPMLGRMHQVLHVPGASQGALPAAHPAAGELAHDAGRHATDLLHALFAGHGTADCQVLDQSTQLGSGSGPAGVAAQVLAQTAPAAPAASAPAARRFAAFRARAPPLCA